MAAAFPDHFVDQQAGAMPKTIIKTLLKIASHAACRIITPDGKAGTCALYSVKDAKELFTALATSQHVLSETSAFSGDTELQFTEIEPLKSIVLEKEWIAFYWTSDSLDAAVVELTKAAVEDLKNKGAKCLQISAEPIQVNSENQPLERGSIKEPLKLAIIQYATYNQKTEMSFAYNNAKLLEYPFLVYRIETTPGSSGSPVLDWRGNALAIHKGAFLNEKELPESFKDDISLKRKGVTWQAILPELLEARKRYGIDCYLLLLHDLRQRQVAGKHYAVQ